MKQILAASLIILSALASVASPDLELQLDREQCEKTLALYPKDVTIALLRADMPEDAVARSGEYARYGAPGASKYKDIYRINMVSNAKLPKPVGCVKISIEYKYSQETAEVTAAQNCDDL